MDNNKLYLYPVWLRMWHALNALCIIMLIVTGISIQYSDIQYPFIPFDTAITLHNIFGVLAVFSYLIFLIGNLVSKNGKQYLIKINGLVRRLGEQSRYYMFGYFKGEPKPFPIKKENKFNPLQRLSYTLTMYFLMPLIVITGVALLFPELIIDEAYGVSGIQLTAVLHSAIGFLISLFLLIHLYVASVGKNPLKNYKSIVTGFHEEH